MNILDKITAHKRHEVEEKKQILPIPQLKQLPLFKRSTLALTDRLISSDDPGIIAEYKRRSPSKGWIAKERDILEIAKGYQQAGAAGMSVLTDLFFFGGRIQDLESIRVEIQLPLLRKDFIVDPYQIYEAKAYGADVILLIAECLNTEDINEFTTIAQDLGMEVLMELHTSQELDKLNDRINIVGINNRNLETFVVDIQTSLELFHQIPDHFSRISESGIHSPKDAILLKKQGFDGFLIGEYFMKTPNPGITCQHFIQAIHQNDQV